MVNRTGMGGIVSLGDTSSNPNKKPKVINFQFQAT